MKKMATLFTLLLLITSFATTNFADSSTYTEMRVLENGGISIQSIPGTRISRRTAIETEQVNQYNSTEIKTVSDSITVTGKTLWELNGNIELAKKSITGSGSGVTLNVGGAYQNEDGWACTISITKVHTLNVQHTVFHENRVTYETLTEIATGHSYTYVYSKVFIRSWVETKYI